jgi:hypothetical protein
LDSDEIHNYAKRILETIDYVKSWDSDETHNYAKRILIQDIAKKHNTIKIQNIESQINEIEIEIEQLKRKVAKYAK